jgi:hypothetical protein
MWKDAVVERLPDGTQVSKLRFGQMEVQRTRSRYRLSAD